MDKDTAIKELKALPQEDWTNGDDFEAGHAKADDILCQLLESLGYQDVVEAFKKVGRWYA
jgi:hypothetical protein